MQLANSLSPNYTFIGSTTLPRKRMLLVLFSKINNRKDLSNWMIGRRVISAWSRNLTSGAATASVPFSPMCSTALWAACGGRINTADPLKKQEKSLKQFGIKKWKGNTGLLFYHAVLMVLDYEGYLVKHSSWIPGYFRASCQGTTSFSMAFCPLL